MPRTALIAPLALLFVAPPAFADARGAEREACTPDVLRLCAAEIPDIPAIKLCLKHERPRLSVACRTVIDSAASPRRLAAASSAESAE